VLAALWAGAKMRAVTATDMNLYSSRSHTIFTIGIERGGSAASGPGSDCGSNGGGYSSGGTAATFSKLCLVDLAGSEKVRHPTCTH
jgi:Kinesin motor domain